MQNKLKIVIASSMLAILSNCDYSESIAAINHPTKLPDGTVQVKDDLYYVPIKRDKDGCMMYQAYSKNNATFSAILYQNKNGSFTLSKNANNCL